MLLLFLALAVAPQAVPEFDPEALLEAAKRSESVARYRSAAELYEEFGRRFPKDKAAPMATAHATVLWRSLGDDARALASVGRYVMLFAKRQPEEAARAVFAARELESSPKARLSAVRGFLKYYRPRTAPAQTVIAHVELARAEWTKSCSKATADGTCGRVVARKSACAEVTPRAMRIHARKLKPAAAAKRDLERALKLAAEVEPPGDLEAEFRDAVGEAMFVQLQPEYEALVGTQRMRDKERMKRAAALARGYAAVLTSRSTHWSIAAARRTAELFAHVANLRPDCRDARITHRLAVDAFVYCTEKAIATHEFSEDARHCEAAVQRLAPKHYPKLVEFTGAPAPPEAELESIGVITDTDYALRVGARLTRDPAL